MTRRTEIGAYVYPWDLDGDPTAAGRLASLGVRRASVAAAYHAVRALTPRHPAHRVVTADHSAVYYPLDTARWTGPLRPAEAAWSPRSFGRAVTALNEAGLEVYAWTILAHSDGRFADATVVNAYGDRFPWALCIAQEAVQRYCATLAAESASQPGLAGLELESCGWYGFDHLHAHDKTAGVPLPPSAKLLFSLCFCATCADAYAAAGTDPARLRADVRAALDPVFAGTAADARLSEEQTAAVTRMRIDTAARLRARALTAIHAERPDLPVLLHANPDPLACGASPGLPTDAASAPVLLCNVRSEAALDAVRAYAGPDRRVVATVTAVEGLGGNGADLAAWCTDLVDAGATELRFYHPGLASTSDWDAMREAVVATS
ncbi:hypothetical protein DN069_03275 [Streptacidiphilus pinicola]|uniref:Alanine-rich protein n=1 Tax=Streptacidiphilus pinicola TaxID=2219663 RepID=A0A2X0JH60_9ACTN|nr:hypothetical protein [Streptacidiphilus pinicola]RAG86998.1 hypothetical protein DN069_03275 [Streptacidiphilus pinicola]